MLTHYMPRAQAPHAAQKFFGKLSTGKKEGQQWPTDELDMQWQGGRSGSNSRHCTPPRQSSPARHACSSSRRGSDSRSNSNSRQSSPVRQSPAGSCGHSPSRPSASRLSPQRASSNSNRDSRVGTDNAGSRSTHHSSKGTSRTASPQRQPLIPSARPAAAAAAESMAAQPLGTGQDYILLHEQQHQHQHQHFQNSSNISTEPQLARSSVYAGQQLVVGPSNRLLTDLKKLFGSWGAAGTGSGDSSCMDEAAAAASDGVHAVMAPALLACVKEVRDCLKS